MVMVRSMSVFVKKFAKALEQLANDPSVNNYNDFLQALSDGSEKGDFVNQVSEKLAKDLNKEMKTGSKLFNNVDNLFNGDKDATLKRLMHGNTPRNQKNVGFKPEMAANGANNARHFAWALHEGQLGARAAQLMDFAEFVLVRDSRNVKQRWNLIELLLGPQRICLKFLNHIILTKIHGIKIKVK